MQRHEVAHYDIRRRSVNWKRTGIETSLGGNKILGHIRKWRILMTSQTTINVIWFGALKGNTRPYKVARVTCASICAYIIISSTPRKSLNASEKHRFFPVKLDSYDYRKTNNFLYLDKKNLKSSVLDVL